ncbi:golgi uridine diphosphate-N- acetylglucosamine transporter [Tulasnella sp. 330]|nr:golgi uridine diphosphate-N- acetylglucosamine transporter [Tulasnella sp. 330]KAG8882921.1 golgi uridine diphosphate-N- acetylglucosamine transporter [Tulasnella sp. 331]KAG8891005.1 golgi uridine diphosphate-N- acetylglucosamine transporter [Tulasnella sp. 332]
MSDSGYGDVMSAVVQSTALGFLPILSLIIGGCCSNAWALELATAHNPHLGTLITFAQYIIIVIFRLPKQLTARAPQMPTKKRSEQPGHEDSAIPPPIPFWRKLLRLRFKKLRVPLRIWLTQVVLFWLTSILNNWALGFDVNLAVHIIFRSGGLAANVIVGMLAGKKYTRLQVTSVVLVTLGVACSTLSSPPIKKSRGNTAAATSTAGSTNIPHSGSCLIGIFILSAALLLSAVMGIAQENANEKYGKGNWEESLFYLHFLGLPMFSFVGRDLMNQLAIANASPNIELSARSLIAATTPAMSSLYFTPVASPILTPYPHKYPDITSVRTILHWLFTKAIEWLDFLPTVSIPSFWVPLAVNVVTQFFCASGVNRLTSRASSLTVTLVLVVRKAVSLGISVLFVQERPGDVWLWAGAVLVLVGSLTYSLDGALQKTRKESGRRIKKD